MTFFVTVAICVVIAALGIYFQVKFTARSITQGPALLTMLGIAGTFFGIAIGLFRFDANDIQGSIPTLLGGMQISIWASFVGILFAIFLKVRYALSAEDTGVVSEDASDAELIAAQLQSLERAISGDGENTVLAQLKLSRTEIIAGLDALNRSQALYMEKLAEVSSKTLVEALRDVIRDFNKNLTEQFGGNFKELNAAVGRLLTWQEQYKAQMDNLIAIEKDSASIMHAAVDRLASALSSSESLLFVAQSFGSILDAADAYKGSLKTNTESLASLVDGMQRDLPALRVEVVSLVKSLGQSVTRSEGEVARIGAEISERFKAAADTIEHDLVTALTTANREVNENTSRLLGSVREQTEALQVGIEESVSESIRSMAEQLASLSNKFVEDYGPITERLRAIVNSGRVA
jgi:DNA anti-recombination protein RmuC